jgi:hypothetical protein
MLLIILITLLIATSAVLLYVIAIKNVFSKIGAPEEKSYYEMIWLQILKTVRKEKNVFRELLWCEEGDDIYQCLVIKLSDKYTMSTAWLAISV